MNANLGGDFSWWITLLLAALGTYMWRGLGVLFSGHINQEGEIFRWLSAVTYAMVAALTFRLILLPVGLLEEVPVIYRIIFAVIAVLIALSKRGRLVPALIVGSGCMVIYGVIQNYLS